MYRLFPVIAFVVLSIIGTHSYNNLLNDNLDKEEKILHIEKTLKESSSKINELKDNLNDLKELLKVNEVIAMSNKNKKHISKKKSINVIVTAYTTHKSECGKSDGITSMNEKAIPFATAAVGKDLKHLKNKTVYIPFLGIVVRVNDDKARHQNGLDICVRTKSQAYEIGREIREIIPL